VLNPVKNSPKGRKEVLMMAQKLYLEAFWEILGNPEETKLEITDGINSYFLTVDTEAFHKVENFLKHYSGTLSQWREIARDLHGDLKIPAPVDINRL
jgi:hypothetical protein